MTLLSFLSAGTVHDLGWTLLHFLWQGLLLAAALELILCFVRGTNARHNWALATLVLMMLAPVLTFLVLHGQGSAFNGNGVALTPSAGVSSHLDLIVTSAPPSLWVNWLVLLWLSGIAALSLRALGGLVLVETLRRRDTEVLPSELMERCRALQQRLHVTRPVRFLQSLRVSVPVVIGWFRPVILLPVSALAGLPPQQLDALILHELAHIRRHDAFINAMLLAAETALFYHPAVWWVSRRIRIERENCCDDLAVAHCGGAALYVEALASLEAGRLPPGLALAAGGRLKDRAARLLGVPSQARRYSLGAITGLAVVTLIAVSVAVAQPGPVAPAQTPAIQVPENAVVGTVGFVGNSRITVRDLSHEIHIKAGDVVTRAAVEADVTILKELYRRNGKYFARIEPGFIRAGNRTDLVYTITEGPTVGIDRIDFVGNKAFDADTLKAQILTKESAWYRPLSTDDNYDPDRLAYDRELLRRFYVAKGYGKFLVLFTAAQLTPDGRNFNITFTLSEDGTVPAGYVPPLVAMPNTPEPLVMRTKIEGLVITDDKGAQPPINIHADRMSKSNVSGFPTQWEGNVSLQQGGTMIHADYVLAENTSPTPAAPGGTLTRLIADGHVVLTQNGKTSRGTHLEAVVIDNALKPALGRSDMSEPR